MKQKETFRQLANLENHKCFGCSPTNPFGLRMQFYTKDDAIYSWVTVSEHLCGWENLVHGGVITAMLDEIMGRGAMYLLKKLVMTRDIQVRFHKPVLVQEELTVKGMVKKVVNDREAILTGELRDQSDQLLAEATGIFALFSPDRLKQKSGMNPTLIEGLERLIQDA